MRGKMTCLYSIFEQKMWFDEEVYLIKAAIVRMLRMYETMLDEIAC